jgi:hypothetical protein
VKKYLCFAFVALLIAGVLQARGSDDTARPKSFESREEATRYVARFFAGGQVDDVALGADHYFVLVEHGSGIPVLGFAEIYHQEGARWKWIAKASVPRFEFARAVALDGKIVAIGERTHDKTVLYAPKRR